MSTNYVHESQTIRVRATNYTYPLYRISCPRTMYMSHKLYVYAPQTTRIHPIESYSFHPVWKTDSASFTLLFSDVSTNYVYESQTMCVCVTNYMYAVDVWKSTGRGGGLGSRPQKMYGERLRDGVEYHLMSPTPRR